MTYGPSFQVVNLVSDMNGTGAMHTDTSLVNAWGIAISPTGRLWVSSTGKGVTTIYDGSGTTLIPPVKIMSDRKGSLGQPTGAVFNSSKDFALPVNKAVSKFIYAGLDGSITAWASGDTAGVVASRSGASFTGLAIGNDGTGNFLYAANYAQGTIDVFDASFNYLPGKTFSDPKMPQGYNPYNVQVMNGMLYVTYAASKGYSGGYYGSVTGYVDIYNLNGTLASRFASEGTLNYPWGIAAVPSSWGMGSNMILIGNFGDGRINVFDQSGNYQGQLQSGGNMVVINGLWALVNPPTTATTLDQNAVYFAAGPNGQLHGVVGYLKPQ